MSAFKDLVREALLQIGFDMRSVTNSIQHARRTLLQQEEISVVFDVGANIGQYARELRAFGYTGRIISFEPLSEAFSVLQRTAARDQRRQCLPYALGSTEAELTMHVAENLVSSSLLPVTAQSTQYAPNSRTVSDIRVPVRTLDSLRAELLSSDDRVYLKLDVQGYEQEVLKGAGAMLAQVRVVEAELSLTSMYEHQPLYLDMCRFLGELGFNLCWVERCVIDPAAGRMLQVDGIFLKDA
ncbi:MAG TPA: FkbM family methyltransferase [Armatimonadota bacterium]|jgi:FkbM family methyltransferase